MNSLIKQVGLFLLLQANKGILYKIVNSYCSDPENRKHLVQEIIIQWWKSFDKYTDLYKYSTWVYRISPNEDISFYRKKTAESKSQIRYQAVSWMLLIQV